MILSLRNRLKALVYLGAAILLVVGLFDGGPEVAGITLGRLAIVEAGLFAFLALFNQWFWRQRPVVALVRSGPVLRGTWKGVVTSADTGNEYEAYLSVRQSFIQIEIRLMTAESTSETTSCQLINRPEGLAVIEYVYQNVPRPTVRERSAIHLGGVHLEAVGSWPAAVTGEYWTSRQTRGELKFDQRNSKVTQTFDAAQSLFKD